MRFLVQWLISRAQQIGAERSIEDLARYLQAVSIEVAATLAIDGFEVERNLKIGDYELVSWNDVPMTDTKWHFASRQLFSGDTPTAALIQRHKIQRAHVRPWDVPGPNDPLSIEPTLDVLRCMTAVAGAGFRLLHYWFEPPEWAPWAVSRSTFGVDSTSLPMPVALSEAVVPLLIESASRLRELDESSRMRLRVPLDRLNRSYLAGMRNVDKAIELGIALESLYAPAKMSEGIAFAVRTRAARFLGGSPHERHSLVTTLRDVYDLRSRAVHSGRFDADGTKKWRDDVRVRQVLGEGQRVVGRSLVKAVREGEPNWEDFDIGIAKPTSAIADVER